MIHFYYQNRRWSFIPLNNQINIFDEIYNCFTNAVNQIFFKDACLSLNCSEFSGKYILSENSKVLEVTDVQNGSDTGVYQCMSENSEGVLLKEAILKVIGK